MLLHNFKLAWRNLRRNSSFSLINIGGLTVGLASCIIIGLYTFHELSFDSFHKDHTRIYRVNKNTNEKGGQPQRDGITPGQLAPVALKQLPEVEMATRYRPWFNEMLVSHDSTHLKMGDVLYTDASFLQLFNFPLVKGDSKQVLSNPFAAVITESVAKQYFGDRNPIGQTLTTLNNIPVTITGVAKDVPNSSSIKFNMLISWSTIEAPAYSDQFSWMNNMRTQVVYTFLKLKQNVSTSSVAEKLSVIMHKERPDEEFQYRPYLQSLSDIHLGSADIRFAGDFIINSKNVINTLLIITLFILLIAGFNFINLSTAGALSRAKETGVQKVLGAGRGQLFWKYFTESFVICLCSMLTAVLLAQVLLPWFNSLAGSNLHAGALLNYKAIGILATLLLLISLLSGIYPAVFLSRFKSTDVFRNVIRAGNDKWLRKSLVTIQFALSILLIMGTIVVNNQMSYMASRDLGFEKDQVAIIQLANTNIELQNKTHTFINSLKQFPGITDISSSNRVPGQSFTGYGIIPEGHTLDEHLQSNVLETDAGFANAYKIKMKQGRFFSPEFKTDTAEGIVINEAMARMLNWTDPVGKKLEIHQAREGKVIGVMKDFNFASLRETVQPLAIILNDNPLYVSVRLKGGEIQSSLDYIQKTWKGLDNQYPFDYFFLDEQLNKYYQSDNRLLNVLSIFAGLAVVIACMGLLGLTIYTAKQRTKEMGIRKVLGASVTRLAVMLSADFIRLVLLAAIIALPLAAWVMHDWLQDFAYRVPIGPGVFILSGCTVLLIALLTVSIQGIKAALANPVKSLRSE